MLNYQTPGSGGRDWKTVWRAGNNFEANLAVAKLQEHGLHARVGGENVNTMAPQLAIAGPPVVQVLDDEVAEARLLLEAIDEERKKRQADASTHCPACGAPQAKRRMPLIRHIANVLLAATVVFAAIEVPGPIIFTAPTMVLLWLWPVTPRWRCVHCGNRWTAPELTVNEDDEDD